MVQTQPPTTPSTTPTPPPSPENPIRSDARFWIAFAIIIGLIIILMIVVAQAQYTQASTLAGIFSGWITSIVAFYFYGQTTTNAQSQIAQSHQTATNANRRADASDNKLKKVLESLDRSEKVQTALSARQTRGLTPEMAQQDKLDAHHRTLQEIKEILSQP